MARVGRFRTRSYTISGTRTFTTNGVPDSAPFSVSFTATSTCSDSHGRPIVDSDFSSVQVNSSLAIEGIANGPKRGSGNTFHGVIYQQFPVDPTPQLLGNLVAPNDWYAQTVARSNPSRPIVTPAVLIQDLYEIPRQLRDIGRLMNRRARDLNAKDLANQHLALQFGWLPLIDDVKTLLDLQSHIDRRIREFQSLQSSGGLRRRLTLAEDDSNAVVKYSQSIDLGVSITTSFSLTMKRRIWATIHWKPTILPPNIPQDRDMNRLARKVVLGLTPEGLAKGAWEVIPWTWMINWFIGVGSFILSKSNTVPASPSSACLMNEVISTCIPTGIASTIGGVENNSVRGTGVFTKTVKTRSLSGGPVIGVNIPFIGIFRLSILGALFIQRFQR